jgi:hypothetical protein
VHQTAEELSERYTESKGHRLADILHVSTALHPGAEAFLTFEANQKILAEAEGLTVKASTDPEFYGSSLFSANSGGKKEWCHLKSYFMNCWD